jgi:hypothetical protein
LEEDFREYIGDLGKRGKDQENYLKEVKDR